MNSYQLVKNTEWKEVEINGDMKEIPVNWEVKKINQVAKVIAGQSPDMQNINEKDGIDFHQGNTLFSSKFIQSSTKKIIKEKAKKVAPVNSILMSVRAPVGETNITQQEIAIGRGLAALVPFIDRDYLLNVLRLNKDNISGLGNGSTFEGMKISEFSEFEFAFSTQQSSIASILSHQESIIQDIESLISKYEARFQYLSDELLSGRLRVKEVDGQIVLYKNLEDNWKEIEINGEMKEIPKDWMVDKLKNKSKIHSGGTPSKKEGYYGGNIPWITTTDLNFSYIEKTEKNITELGLKNSSAKLIQKNTVLLAMYGASIGKLGISSKQSTTNQSIACIIPNNDFDYKFLFLYFLENKEKIANMGCGNGQPNISQEILKELDIYFPNNLEQKLIANILNQQEELINQQKLLLVKEKQKFNWLLDNLLSGKYLVEEIK